MVSGVHGLLSDGGAAPPPNGRGIEPRLECSGCSSRGGIISSAVPHEGVGEDVVESGLYPTVGVYSECPKFGNFGERSIYFDI